MILCDKRSQKLVEGRPKLLSFDFQYLISNFDETTLKILLISALSSSQVAKFSKLFVVSLPQELGM